MTQTAKTLTIADLETLEQFQIVTIQTAYGSIRVQKLQYGAEAWTLNENVSDKDSGVFCMTATEAFEHQLAVAKAAAPIETVIEESFEAAAQQALAVDLLFADETTAPTIWRAHEKARRELKENGTINFKDGILTFVSRGSGLRYIITKDGCSTNCKAFDAKMFCYHRALYSILAQDAANNRSNVIPATFGRSQAQARRAA